MRFGFEWTTCYFEVKFLSGSGDFLPLTILYGSLKTLTYD